MKELRDMGIVSRIEDERIKVFIKNSEDKGPYII